MTFAVVLDCPRNVRIEPSNGAQAYQNLTCHADSHPQAEYIWIDHINNNNVTVGQTFTLKPGQYSLTCRATVNNATCTQGNPVCRQNGSYAWKQGNDPNVPFQLFNFAAPKYAESCEATATIYGVADGEFNQLFCDFLKSPRLHFSAVSVIPGKLFSGRKKGLARVSSVFESQLL